MHLTKVFILAMFVTLFISTIVECNEEVTVNITRKEEITVDNSLVTIDASNEEVTVNVTNEEVNVTNEVVIVNVTNDEVTEDVTNDKVTEDVTNDEVTEDVTIVEELTEEEYICTEEIHILKGSEGGDGHFRINFEQNCTIRTYQVKCLNKSSIIKIKSIFTEYSNLANSNLTSQIQVILKENTTFSDGTTSLIDVNKWIIDSKNKTSYKDQIFFSQTADLTLIVTMNEIWPEIDLTFLYEEVEFLTFRDSSSDREGIIFPWASMEGRRYRPNSAYVFLITKAEDLNANSIHLGLNKLHIDEGIGEYLLVGAGKDVLQGPPPIFISSLASKKEIKINDENAYIVFVAASTRSHYSGFEITWKYNGTRITGKEDVTVDPAIYDESDSMPICIYNISAALNELNKSEDSFGKFRERLASLGNEYAKKNGKNLKIDSSQVRIIRVSAVIEKNDTLYVMVKIQHTEDGKASFDWKQMGHILNEYSSRYHSEVDDGYWIEKCPQETRRKDHTYIIFYAIAPVLCCLLFVLILNWKQTPFPRMFSTKVKNAIIGSRKFQMVPKNKSDFPDHYAPESERTAPESECTAPEIENTAPEIEITFPNEEKGLLNEIEQESVTLFNREDMRRSNSSRSNPRRSRSPRSSARDLKRPETNMAYKDDDDDVHNTPGISTSAANTVSSQKSLLSTKL